MITSDPLGSQKPHFPPASAEPFPTSSPPKIQLWIRRMSHRGRCVRGVCTEASGKHNCSLHCVWHLSGLGEGGQSPTSQAPRALVCRKEGVRGKPHASFLPIPGSGSPGQGWEHLRSRYLL